MADGSFSGARFRHAFSDIEARDLEHAKERIRHAVETWGMKLCYIESIWLKPEKGDGFAIQIYRSKGKDGAIPEGGSDQ